MHQGNDLLMLFKCTVIGGLLTAAAVAQAPDNMTQILTRTQTTGAATGRTLGSFTYDAVQDRFHIGIFGTSTGFRRYDVSTATGADYITDSDLLRFARSSDVPGGVTSANDTGKANPSGLLLNKTTLSYTVLAPGGGTQLLTYPPGTLAFSIDNSTEVFVGGSSVRYNWTKKMYRWDLRAVGLPTSVQPDYGNAQDGLHGSPPCPANTDPNYAIYFNPFPYGWGCGYADWNDVLAPLVTTQDMITAAGNPVSKTLNQGRQPAWSSDGLSIYFNDSAGVFGGIWKVDAQTGALNWIYHATATTAQVNTEPCVVSTAVRDFNPSNPSTGDQIFFAGSVDSGNAGGLDYLIDSAGTVTGPFPAFTRQTFNRWAEWNGKFNKRAQLAGGIDPLVNAVGTLNIFSTAADADGTVYFYENTSLSHCWRFTGNSPIPVAMVRNVNQQARFNAANGSTSTTGQMLRMQMRHANFTGPSGSFDIPQIMFRDNASGGISAVNVFKPGDFNRDNVFDATDVSLFMTALGTPLKTFATGTTTLSFYEAPEDGSGNELEAVNPGAYRDYVKFDLNGNGLVTVKDRQMLAVMLGKARCDFDWDGDIDGDDFGHFQQCYTGTPSMSALQQLVCDDADLDGDLKVNTTDYTIFNNCSTRAGIPANPLCGL